MTVLSRPAALVTGARRGIGRAIALRLAESGFDIAATDVVEDEHCRSLEAEVQARGATCLVLRNDVADLGAQPGLIEAVLARFSGLHCFVSNAGIGTERGDMLDLAPETFDRVLGVNLRGAAFLGTAAARAILATGGERRSLIFVTSVSAETVSADRPDYCVSKAGLSAWAKALAVRLAPEGVPVFEVRPGIVRTDMTEVVAGRYEARIAEGLVPARRWGEGADVADAVAALASGAFQFCTGTVVDVGGGLAIPRL